MPNAPPTDDEIIAALRSLHERFLATASSELLVTKASFLRYGDKTALLVDFGTVPRTMDACGFCTR